MSGKLTSADFGPGKIETFSAGQLGDGWENISRPAAYKLNNLLKRIPLPWQITSAWRSKEHNARVGGSSDSRHVTGDAFDVWVQDPKFFTRERLEHYLQLARAVGFRGAGFYEGQTFFHVDDRPDPRTWAKVKQSGKVAYIKLSDFFNKYGAAAGGGAAVLLLFFLALSKLRR